MMVKVYFCLIQENERGHFFRTAESSVSISERNDVLQAMSREALHLLTHGVMENTIPAANLPSPIEVSGDGVVSIDYLAEGECGNSFHLHGWTYFEETNSVEHGRLVSCAKEEKDYESS